jgi:hypothetical protein
MMIVPGINFIPWDVFGFIDDSIDRILTPFSGPRGDYEGAELDWPQARCNEAMRLARIVIEKTTAWSALFFTSAARQRAARLQRITPLSSSSSKSAIF